MDATRQMKVPFSILLPLFNQQPNRFGQICCQEETQNPEEVEELKERLKDLEERMNQMQPGTK